MNKLLVTYDLVGSDESSGDYELLIKKIKRYPTWCKVQKSVWVVKTSDSSTTVRDALWAHMDRDDRLFVGVLSGAAAWQNAICDDEALKEALR